MPTSEETLRKILANAKSVPQLPEAFSFEVDDYIPVFNVTTGKLVKIKKSNIVFTGEPITEIVGLTDTPSSRLGQKGKILVVSEDETKFEYKVLAEVTGVTQAQLDAKVEDLIADGVLDKAPSQNAVFDALAAKQASLVSGTNIKTINNTSILGSGDLAVGATVNGEYDSNSAAITAGLNQGDIYSLPYDFTKKAYLLAIVGAAQAEDRNSITVNSPSTQSAYPVYMNVYNTAGTNSANTIYLNGKVRSDWGDIRFTDANGNYIPFGIVSDNGDNIQVVFAASLLTGDNVFYIEYNNPYDASLITKFGICTDQHYDPAETLYGRDQALTRLDNFVTRMAAYAPDYILEGGDKHGFVTQTPATRLTNMQIVSDKVSEAATAVGCPKYLWGWGNHDFEFNTFTEIQNLYNGLEGQVAGKLYATWSDANFTYISLDANYKPADDTHHSNSHVGYGYIDAPQRTWLTDTLAAATKPCIILCHQSLAEADTLKIGLAKEIMHVQNRTAIRTILETSGKVSFVLQGHFHMSAYNIINGIPYITVDDINDSWAGTWDTPITNRNGSWNILEIDRGSQIISVKQETKVNATVETVYEFRIPFKTIYSSEYGNNLPATIAASNTSEYDKSGLVCEATDLYINNASWIYTKPASLFDSDPKLTTNSIKVKGLTNAPNYGRAHWKFNDISTIFSVKFSVLLKTTPVGFMFFKIYNASNSGQIAAYFGFPSGECSYKKEGSIDMPLFTASLGTWYDCELIMKPVTKKYTIIVNGTTYAADIDNFTVNNAGLATLNKLEILTETGEYIIDNFRIEKYISPSPTITAIGNTP